MKDCEQDDLFTNDCKCLEATNQWICEMLTEVNQSVNSNLGKKLNQKSEWGRTFTQELTIISSIRVGFAIQSKTSATTSIN